MQIKVLHCAMVVVGCGASIQTPLMTDTLLLFGLCYLAAGQITSQGGDSPCDDLISGLFNHFFYPALGMKYE